MEDAPSLAEEESEDNEAEAGAGAEAEAEAESDEEDAEEQSPVEAADRRVCFYWQINPKHFQTLFDAVAEVQEMKGTPPVPAETGVLRRPPPKYCDPGAFSEPKVT